MGVVIRSFPSTTLYNIFQPAYNSDFYSKSDFFSPQSVKAEKKQGRAYGSKYRFRSKRLSYFEFDKNCLYLNLFVKASSGNGRLHIWPMKPIALVILYPAKLVTNLISFGYQH